jgi:hypothetical protein
MNLIKNIQFQQLINLILLLVVAYFNNTLQTTPIFIFLLALYSVVLEFAINYYTENKIYFPYSAAIASLGVILMVGFLKWYIPYIVVTIAILQKRLLKIDNRHIFNPSNLALISALFLFYPKALPIVGQLGFQGWFVIFLVIILAIIILFRVNRIYISISFLFFYILLEYIIIGKTDPMWNFDKFINGFYSTSFIVYIFFMLTDPVTTPNAIKKQIIFSFLVAFIIVMLDFFIGIHIRNIFIALFLTSVIFIPFYRNNLGYNYYLVLFVSFLISWVILTRKPIYFSM